MSEGIGSLTTTKKAIKAIERIFEAFFGKAGGGPRGYGARKGSFLGGLKQINKNSRPHIICVLNRSFGDELGLHGSLWART